MSLNFYLLKDENLISRDTCSWQKYIWPIDYWVRMLCYVAFCTILFIEYGQLGIWYGILTLNHTIHPLLCEFDLDFGSFSGPPWFFESLQYSFFFFFNYELNLSHGTRIFLLPILSMTLCQHRHLVVHMCFLFPNYIQNLLWFMLLSLEVSYIGLFN